jgi:regulator of sigma E protease
MLTSLPLLASALSIPLAILGIGFLIAIHEYGHYLACRLTKTRVETFSIGFGPRLFGWESKPGTRRRFTWGRRQEDPAERAMDFRVAAIPLGGYVKMAGETPGEAKTGAPDEFSSKPMRSRFVIVVAGVVMNAITAVAFYSIAIAGGVSQVPPVIGEVEIDGAARAAGLRPGDRVLEVDGKRTPTFLDLQLETAVLGADEPATFLVERDGRRLELSVRPRYSEEYGVVRVHIRPAQEVVFGKPPSEFVVGASEAVTVADVPARGGSRALVTLGRAIELGIRPVPIRRADGTSYSVDVGPAADAAKEKPQYKVGVEAYAHPQVTLARDSASAFQAGDELLGARSGDQRVSIVSVSTYHSLQFLPSLDEIVVRRKGAEQPVALSLGTRRAVVDFLDDLGVEFPPTTNQVNPFSRTLITLIGSRVYRYPSVPAAEAGLLPGERILRVGDKKIERFSDLTAALQGLEDAKPLALVVQGLDGTERSVAVTPVALVLVGELPAAVRDHLEPMRSEGALDAVGMAVGKAWRDIGGVFRQIGAFFSGSINFKKNIAGPITIVSASASKADQDFLELLWFLGYISVMLAVLNILPIPVLDGGHLLFMAMEKIKGRPLREETIGRMQFVGFALLMLLMFFAISNDIGRL